MFRKVELPSTVSGNIYLHSMPGRKEPLADTFRTIHKYGISKIVSLTSLDEINNKSPELAVAIETDELIVERISFPIDDYGIPTDRNAFLELSNEIAVYLKDGESILIHCGAGRGRTGTLAVSILMSLGIKLNQATQIVAKAKSYPETHEQVKLLEWIGSNLSLFE